MPLCDAQSNTGQAGLSCTEAAMNPDISMKIKAVEVLLVNDRNGQQGLFT